MAYLDPSVTGIVRVDPYLLLLAALAVDSVAGEMPWLFRRIPHPVVLIGRTIGLLDQKLNRDSRSAADRMARGFLTVVVMVLGAGLLGVGIHRLALTVPYAWIGELVLVAILIAQRSLYQHVAAVGLGLARDGLAGGRAAVSMICGRDPMALDEPAVARAAIESCAENFSDGVVAPVFWYLLLGLPGILIYKTVNTLDSMIGHRSERYRAFGFAAARLDDGLNWVPARLSGLLITLAALFAPTAHPAESLRTMLRDARRHRSPNSGWPEAAMAGALDLALAGPRRYHGYVADDEWIGRGRTTALARDIGRALSLFTLACLLNAGMVVAAWAAGVWLPGGDLLVEWAEDLWAWAAMALDFPDWLGHPWAG